MMQLIEKWSVILSTSNAKEFGFFVNDNHLSNVLNHISKMDFGDVILVKIEKMAKPKQQGHSIGESLGSARLQSD